jgi:hypothetical protein
MTDHEHHDPHDTDEGQRRREAADEVLLDSLAAGNTYARAGELAGCSPRTVRRRVTDPDFRAELARRRAARTLELVGTVSALESLAVQTIRECLTAEKDADRLRAAGIALSLGQRLRQAVDVDDRLAAQEAMLADLLGEGDDDGDLR